MVEDVTRHLETYAPNLATATIARFLDDLSNWYLRRSRRRFWARTGETVAADRDKQEAYSTLYQVLLDLTLILAPFTPFVTEAMYQNLVVSVSPDAPKSVHHQDWPVVERHWSATGLLQEMDVVKRLVTLGHAVRQASGLKVRQPLAEAAFVVPGTAESTILEKYGKLIAEELNVKRVRALDKAGEVVDFALKPLPRQLGQKYASRFPAIRAALLQLPPAGAAQALLAGNSVAVEVDGARLEILPEEVEVQVRAHPGLAAVAEGAWVAALRIDLTPQLVAEGLAREFVRRAQDLRRKAALEPDQRVGFRYAASPGLAQAVRSHRDFVAGEILAQELLEEDPRADDLAIQDEFDGEHLHLALAIPAPRGGPVDGA
jgi:isoleucyl-tRNA synthetase